MFASVVFLGFFFMILDEHIYIYISVGVDYYF